MKDVLAELNAIEKAHDLKERNLLPEESCNCPLKGSLERDKNLRLHTKIIEISEFKNFKIFSPYYNTYFLITAQSQELIITDVIRHQAQIYNVTKNKVEELDTYDPGKILAYLANLDTEVKSKSNFAYIFIFIFFMLGIFTLFFINETMPKAAKRTKFEKNAVNICSKIIPNSKNYSISTKKISQNEIQVKFSKPRTDEYHIGIFLIDTQKCERTR